MEYTKGLAITGPSVGLGSYDDGGDYAITTIINGGEVIVGEAIRRVGEFDYMPAKGNATLWAAAPDLLEALELATQFVGKYVADTESVIGKRALDRMNTAIAKARGS